MGQTPMSQNKRKALNFMYKSKLYADKMGRLRLLPLSMELSRRIQQLKDKEVLVSIYELADIEIKLPWLMVQKIKKDLLEASSEDIKAYMSFVAYDVVNSYIKTLIPSLTIAFSDSDVLEISDDYVAVKNDQIKVRRIKASGFTINLIEERRTKNISITCELYDLPDELDAYNFSRCGIAIGLRELLEELNIGWDISRQ